MAHRRRHILETFFWGPGGHRRPLRRDRRRICRQRHEQRQRGSAPGGGADSAAPDVELPRTFRKIRSGAIGRGFQVYHSVCGSCHSLNLVAFRDLADLGGPGFTEAEVKALAASYQIEDGPNEQGQMFKRPGRPSHHFPPPFPNPEAAKAVFGAAPPDMSDLAKARGFPRPFPLFVFDAFTEYQEQGPDYIVAVLNGFTHPNDPNWNFYFPGHKIAMPKPLADGAVQYTDGTPPTLANYSRDVAAFLYWEPNPSSKSARRRAFVSSSS